jgi:hypothetical protein
MKPRTTLLYLLLPAACITEPPETSVDVSEIDVSDSTLASSFATARAGRRPFTNQGGLTGTSCTVTVISPNFAVSAAHCGFVDDEADGVDDNDGSLIELYDANTPGHTSFTRNARVDKVFLRPGVDPAACNNDLFPDCDDNNGVFADIALLRLNTTTPAISRATLAWKYPGLVVGTKVGAGNHDGFLNENGSLRQVNDLLDDATATDGSFITSTVHTDGGDSGGPFYVNKRVVGVLWGQRYNPEDAHYDLYTSAPIHLPWILASMDYRWPGVPSMANTAYSGTTIESFTAPESVCQYACEKTSTCDAYNHSVFGTCTLLANPTGATSSTSTRGALRHGASSARSNDIVSFVRDDNQSTVLERSATGRVVERTPGFSTITHSFAPAVAVGGKISAYRRADGIDVAVYRSTSNRLIELVLGTNASFADMNTSVGGPNPVGDPVAYVRADGISAIVYRSSNNHLHEMRLTPSGWIVRDLLAGMTMPTISDPHAYARSDGYSSVLFREGTTIRELYKHDGETWTLGTPNGNAPAANGRPFGYTRADGTNTIAYRSSGNIIELRNGSSWAVHQLTTSGQNPTALGDPSAYVRADGFNAVLYRGQTFGGSPTIMEVAGGAVWTLPSVDATGEPMPNVRADATSTVLHRSGTSVGRLSLGLFDPDGWSFALVP